MFEDIELNYRDNLAAILAPLNWPADLWGHWPSPRRNFFFFLSIPAARTFPLSLTHHQVLLGAPAQDLKTTAMDHSISKKRKRKEAEAVAAAASAEKISKKSKKATKPAPAKEPESSDEEDDDFEGFDEEEQAEDDEEQDDAAESEEEEDDDKEDGADLNGADLPTDNAPILPLGSDAQSFDQLKLSDKTMNAINEMGFTKMTSIQKTVSCKPHPAAEIWYRTQTLTRTASTGHSSPPRRQGRARCRQDRLR